MQQIKPGIYIEQTYMGVTLGALVYPHGTIYIDAPLRAEDARAWRTALLGQRSGPNRLLITLDSHIDRTLGAKAFDCPIMAHEKAAQISRSRPSVFKGQSADNGSDWEGYVDSIGTRWAIPDITFSHQVSLYWGGPEVIVEHHAGPTPGSLWVIIPKEEVIFIGDAVVVNQPPFLANADLPAWQESLTLLAQQYKHYQIISSRSGVIAVEDIRHQHTFLKDLTKRLERLSKKSATPQATEKIIPTLLSHFDLTKDKEEQYYKRLQSGLYEYFARQAQPAQEPEEVYPLMGDDE
jgi:glyoxylase-like metal-dependent hydrolase (beta-lactamase superfamily II)